MTFALHKGEWFIAQTWPDIFGKLSLCMWPVERASFSLACGGSAIQGHRIHVEIAKNKVEHFNAVGLGQWDRKGVGRRRCRWNEIKDEWLTRFQIQGDRDPPDELPGEQWSIDFCWHSLLKATAKLVAVSKKVHGCFQPLPKDVASKLLNTRRGAFLLTLKGCRHCDGWAGRLPANGADSANYGKVLAELTVFVRGNRRVSAPVGYLSAGTTIRE